MSFVLCVWQGTVKTYVVAVRRAGRPFTVDPRPVADRVLADRCWLCESFFSGLPL